MYIAGYMVTGFLVAGAYAFARLRGRWGRYERTALAIPLTIAALASPVQVLRRRLERARGRRSTQPIKLAAFEGLGQTTRARPIHLLGWYTDGKVKYGIGIPTLLSLLAVPQPRTRPCRGSTPSRPSDRPPVNVVRVAFQTMVGIGTLLALLGVVYLVRSDPATTAAASRPGSTAPSCVAGPAVARRADRRLGRRPRSAASHGSSTT